MTHAERVANLGPAHTQQVYDLRLQRAEQAVRGIPDTRQRGRLHS